MSKIITFGNFKGGCGKTTNACNIAYQLSKKGLKTLLVDLDPQADATSLFINTKRSQTHTVVKINSTLMTAVSKGDLRTIVTPVRKNLYLLPSYSDFTSYPLFLEKKFPNSMYDRAVYFNKLLNPLVNDFDYIIIDTPPTVSIYTDSALMSSNYIVIILQTQERAFTDAEAFITYLQELINNYHAHFEIAGILPVLLKNSSQVDQLILKESRKKFGTNNVFKSIVKNRERLKRYDIEGIQDPDCKSQKTDYHDKKINALYLKITNEFLKRVNK